MKTWMKTCFSCHSGQLKFLNILCLRNLQDLDNVVWDYMDGQLKNDYKLCNRVGGKLGLS